MTTQRVTRASRYWSLTTDENGKGTLTSERTGTAVEVSARTRGLFVDVTVTDEAPWVENETFTVRVAA